MSAATTLVEVELRMVEALITAKKAELTFPTPIAKRRLSDRKGEPRVLFASMLRDLNRATTEADLRLMQERTRNEITHLERRRNRLLNDIALISAEEKVEPNGSSSAHPEQVTITTFKKAAS